MKKGFTYYLVVMFLIAVLFNVIAFVTPGTINGTSKFEGGFWPGYAFIMLSFVLCLISSKSCFDYTDKWEQGGKTTLIFISSVELAIMLVAGLLFMFLPGVKDWVSTICCTIILVVSVIVYMIFKGTTEHASRVNSKK